MTGADLIRTAAAKARRGLSYLFDFALPHRCHGCGVVQSGGGEFCVDCWSGMRFLGPPQCARCGVPFAHDQGQGALCATCLADPPVWTSAQAALAYGDMARVLTMRFKYGRRIGLARMMARHMARQWPSGVTGDALLVPVPLHRWRLWWRGFNQSALLAQALARAQGCAVDVDLIRRTRRTPPLRGMNRARRADTVRGAFAFNPRRDVAALRGRTVILVDDVHTTGATAGACAQLLLARGAAAVHLLTWAQVLDDRTTID